MTVTDPAVHEQDTDTLVVIYVVRYGHGGLACIHASLDAAETCAHSMGGSVDSSFLYNSADAPCRNAEQEVTP